MIDHLNLQHPSTTRNTRLVNSHQQADAAWACQYSIVESGKPKTESITGHADGSFPSREAAELAAVQKAKALIDLR